MRLKQGQLQALEKQLQRLQRSVAMYQETYLQLGLAPDASIVTLQQIVAQLRAVRRQLQNELETLLTHATIDRKDLTRLQELPGFSPLVAGSVSVKQDVA